MLFLWRIVVTMNSEHDPFVGVKIVTAAATNAPRAPCPSLLLHGVPVIEAAHGLSSGFASVAATPESQVGLPAGSVAAAPRGGGELPGEGRTPERATGAIPPSEATVRLGCSGSSSCHSFETWGGRPEARPGSGADQWRAGLLPSAKGQEALRSLRNVKGEGRDDGKEMLHPGQEDYLSLDVQVEDLSLEASSCLKFVDLQQDGAGRSSARGTYTSKRLINGVDPQTFQVKVKHVSLSQAARSLQISKSTMSSLIDSGSIKEGLQWQDADHQGGRGALGAPAGQASHGGRQSSRGKRGKSNISGASPDRSLKACQLCRTAKVKCDGQRPCARCVQRGTGDDCRLECTPENFSQTPGRLLHVVAAAAAFPPAQAHYQLARAPGLYDATRASSSGPNLSLQPLPLHASMGLPQNAWVEKKKPRTNAVKVSVRGFSCVQCNRSKTKCDGDRPCSECLFRGKGDACSDRQQKKDGPHARTSQGAPKAPSVGAAGVAQDMGGGGAGKANISGHPAVVDDVRPFGMRVAMVGVDASSDARSTALQGERSSVPCASTSGGGVLPPPSRLDSEARCASARGAGLAPTDGQA